jgi:RHS repeat-associated protein
MAWQPTELRSFIYDGWNEVAEVVTTPQSTTTNLYVWGLDLSGSLQGAGGIGGLLAATFDNTAALYTYDANGNVSQLVSSDGSLLAHYEYDPFGKTIVSDGVPRQSANSATAGLLAQTNPFRFSTKHWNDATGLGYWGYRWYVADIGRWLSRDPIGERGGLHLYGFVANYPIGFVDPVGFSIWDWGIWPWNWFSRCVHDYEFDDRGWSYGDTWTPGTVGGDVVIVGPDGTVRKSLPLVPYRWEYGLTKTAIEQVGYNCCCKDNAGAYSPTFLLKVSTETWILNRDAYPWGNNDARFRDPRVDDYWRSSWQWWRRRMVRRHERRHRQHAEDNYVELRDALKSEENSLYGSKSACLDAAILALQRSLGEFQRHELRDRERVERGEL